MSSETNRREFLGVAAPAAAFTIVPRNVLGGQGYVAPSDKLTLAHIGMGFQGFSELGGLLAEPEIQIVAVCDPNTDSNDYVEWSRGGLRNTIRRYLDDSTWRQSDSGCPGGREVGRYVVDTYYAKQRGQEKYKAVNVYEDFRELLEKEKDVDAVKVMTPDHHHATICVAAMKKGKHVMVHKPLANRMYEQRLVIDTARQTKVATHLLAYGSGAENGRIAARIMQGVIGPLREIHNWTNRPVWPQYTEIPTDRPPVPKGLNWDLWLGPSLDRPYHPHYTHAVFRGWYDFGGGCMADMGIYSLWPVMTGLNLGPPLSAQAWPIHSCSIVDCVSRPTRNDFSFPAGCKIRFKYAARGNMPELDLFWYDGGVRPRLPVEIESEDQPIEGIYYIGDKGTIVAGFNGQNPRLIAGGKITPLWGETPAPRRGGQQQQSDTGRRALPWLEAFKGGPQSPGSFLNASTISETVCLGTVALRAGGGRKVVFDSANLKITNYPEANRFLVREYRPGWEL
jgi:hypothetical protein